MLLKDLFPQFSSSNSEVSAIEIDSRLVKNGAIFFALQGHKLDGAKFIDTAFENGAIAVVCAKNHQLNSNNKIIEVDDVYEALIAALQKFYPDLPQNIFTVTGTNGKTSVAYFIQQMQHILGKKSASIGTIGIKSSNAPCHSDANTSPVNNGNLTTPDIVSLYKNLAALKQNGIDDIAIEASSIGLEQKRLAGLKIRLGAFTNFTQDHLDYHQSMAKYFDCKMLLFKEVLKPKDIAVLNADIAEFEDIQKIALARDLQVFSYSTKGSSKPYSATISSDQKTLEIFGKKYPLNINLAGDFQKANLLCALLSVLSYYQPTAQQIEFLINNLSQIKPAEGRMQLAATLKNNARIFIDYAHTPDALENVLSTAQKILHNDSYTKATSNLQKTALVYGDPSQAGRSECSVKNKKYTKFQRALVYVLFGCGGDRDHGKRPQMGAIAASLADFVIITDDNPRTENAATIRKEILSGCDLSKTVEIDNRKEAIKQAISRLKANDILIIAGKGHEKYQIIGTEKFEFDEEKIVKVLLKSDFTKIC